ncbi:glutathione S-transferase 1-like [Manduca sexta]|uniref:glutathione S-transferase 1-like n=1 Tax=Manduca sexta TaxID=7130 RepID=UPI00188EE77B|nr:glutathione S-transferase 1-like [Manduca sexta]
MSSLKLYYNTGSAPSRAAFMVAKAVGVPFEVIVVDLFNKEHLKESYTKKNPQHCVPTLEDNDFILWESRAITSYLADKYAKNDQLYPKDLNRRAVVNQRLFFDSTMLYPNTKNIYYPVAFHGATEISELAKKELKFALDLLEHFLRETKWAAGDNATIADISLYATISNALAIGLDISDYPNIQRWVQQCSTLPGADENASGAQLFGGHVKKIMQEKNIKL